MVNLEDYEIRRYKLNDKKEIVPCKNVFEWGEWFENAENKRIDRSHSEDGKILISTVFLGIPHEGGMFETMAFEEEMEEIACERCRTYEDALIQHHEVVTLLGIETNKKFTKTVK